MSEFKYSGVMLEIIPLPSKRLAIPNNPVMHEFMSSQVSIVMRFLDSEQRFESLTCDSQSFKLFRTSDSCESGLLDRIEITLVSEKIN